MVSMTLPIWRKEKIEPGIRAMAAEKEMAVRDEETLDAETANAIGGSLASMENFGAVAKLYRTTLIPQAEQSVQSNLEAYRVGKIDFPMLMDSVMAVLNFRKEYLGMVGESAHDEGPAGGGGGQGTRRRGTMSDEKKEGIPQDTEGRRRPDRRGTRRDPGGGEVQVLPRSLRDSGAPPCRGRRVLQCPGLPRAAPSARRRRQRGESRRTVHLRHAPVHHHRQAGQLPHLRDDA